jgi:hypothetical protein
VTNNRRIGIVAELEARDLAREYWYAPECVRNGQTSGDVCADIGRALPQSSVEVKRRLSVGAFRFLEQAENDARPGQLPLILLREKGNRRWMVGFDASRAEEFVARFLKAMHLHSPDQTTRFVNDARYGKE